MGSGIIFYAGHGRYVIYDGMSWKVSNIHLTSLTHKVGLKYLIEVLF